MTSAAHRTTPIRVRLLRLALAASLPVVLFAAFMVAQVAADQRERETEDMIQHAAALSAAVEQALYGATRELSVLAVNRDLVDENLVAAYEEAVTFAAHSSIGDSISLLAPDGRLLFNTRYPLGAKLPACGDEGGLAETLSTHRPRVSKLFMRDIDHKPAVTVDVPVLRDNRVVYIIHLVVNPQRLAAVLRAQHLHERWTAVVTDRDGTVIARTDEGRATVGQVAGAGLRAAAAMGRAGLYESQAEDGQPVMGAFRRIEPSDWLVAVAVPQADLNVSRTRFLFMLGGSAALMLILAAWLAVRMAKQLERRLLEVGAMARRLGGGQPVHAVATGISELDAAAASLSRAATLIASREAELTRAGKVAHDALSSKAKFFAAANHDLRQPVQSLFLFHATLSTLLPSDHPGMRPLGFADRALQSLQRLLDGLRDVSRLDAGAVVPVMGEVPLGDLLDSLAEEYRLRAADQGIELRHVPCALKVRSDPALLDRVLRNLLENALRYTPRGGRVLLGCRRRGGQAVLQVVDTGIGIPADHLGVIFEEFQQLGNSARNSALGLGLGLAIVRRSCDLLGHAVSVASSVGKGSAFSVHLRQVA